MMRRRLYIFFIFISIVLTCFQVRASHILGGEVTWSCAGSGNYIFELTFYRDCNGFEINTGTEVLKVWNHATINTIDVDFISREDISPSCTQTVGGPDQLACGTGTMGGNGVGAIEKIIYRSVEVNIGIPPASGLFFTYENFSRSNSVTNLQNPSTVGITLTAEMYKVPNQTTATCLDNSPRFLQDPYFVSCAGEQYSFNQHASDIDRDSLVFSWDSPLNYFPTGVYNPPINPNNLDFEPGFSAANPTPDASFNAANVPSVLDTETGEITFTSFNIGGYNIKVRTDAYRDGIKIASVVREMLVFVESCDATNNAPVLQAPFSASSTLEIDVFAGDPVNFTLVSNDNEWLQNGIPQENTITATGTAFGNNFTDPLNGCDVAPCATLNNTPPIVGTFGASVDFNWQTACAHLDNANGIAQEDQQYLFVFKIQDDYCPVPKVKYATVKINVKNQDIIPETKITCIQTGVNDDLTVNWETVSDINNSFVEYRVNSVSGGVLATIPNINTTSVVIPGAATQEGQYFISVVSGCGGTTLRNSDTIKNIFLTLNNPSNGEAILQFNNPYPTQLNAYNDYLHIFREYPLGTWVLYDSVPYGTTFYKDTIDICDPFLNYQVILPTDNCDFTSNIEGDSFEDLIVPDIPNITSLSIDTLTGNLILDWDVNGQADTYGYVIYFQNEFGNYLEVDTVWGINNTQYIANPPGDGPFSYTVAAFDSCFTASVPPTYQTSAKGEPHVTSLLAYTIDICTQEVRLSWSDYIGFSPMEYQIFGHRIGDSWQYFGQTTGLSFNVSALVGESYEYVIKAISVDGASSFSNIVLVTASGQGGPAVSYLSTATVVSDYIEIKHAISLDAGTQSVVCQRYEPLNDEYVTLETKNVDATEIVFIDYDVEVERKSYTYRTYILDSCGSIGDTSNIGKTILLKTITDDVEMKHFLQWSAYKEFPGGVERYDIYRGVDGVFETTPFTTTTPDRRYVEDDVESLQDYSGKICYVVEAIEGSNAFGISEKSRSNVACPILKPLVYIPNAFTVNGKNPIFKPVTSFHQIENYEFAILNRYGQEIFKTSDSQEGWNGRLNNDEIAREGVYLYRLSIRDGNGIEVLKHGHVTLLNYSGISYE